MKTAFVGVRGHVLALDKSTGEVIWKTSLGSGYSEFVTLATDEEYVFAHGVGKVFCLRADDGQILWKNDLPGLGYGIASLCVTASNTDVQTATMAQHQANRAQAASS